MPEGSHVGPAFVWRDCVGLVRWSMTACGPVVIALAGRKSFGFVKFMFMVVTCPWRRGGHPRVVWVRVLTLT